MNAQAESAGWRIWAFDYFDQDSEGTVEAEGAGLLGGLELLWRLVLEEGILDDGRPTFTWFDLETPGVQAFGRPGGRVSIPRDPLRNPELAKLRAWREEAGLIPALARAHQERIDSGGAESILASARPSDSAPEFLHTLEIR